MIDSIHLAQKARHWAERIKQRPTANQEGAPWAPEANHDRNHQTRTAFAANVDEQEIAKFEQLANRWWDKESEFKPLHDINPLRLNYIEERCPLPGKDVLDVGVVGYPFPKE